MLYPLRRLRTLHGAAEIVSIARKPGVHRVYNLEVQSDHVYYVSPLGVLAHNTCAPGFVELTVEGKAIGTVPTFEISASRYPKLAENIQNAQNAGYPSVLTVGSSRLANRYAALERDPGIPKIPGLTRDEYSFAGTREGGAGSWVGHIPSSENSAQGALFKNFKERENLVPGDRFRVKVCP